MASDQDMARRDFVVEFHDRFDEPTLSHSNWIAQYLPQWTTPERSKAFYTTHPGMLALEIHVDQLPWLPEEGSLRVSNIQTAVFSGSKGSDRGTSRHRTDLLVRTPQAFTRLYTPGAPARVEATLRAYPHQDCMLAFWLVGVEDVSPEQSGEICVVEIFAPTTGHDVSGYEQKSAKLNTGVKKYYDPNLHDDMSELILPGFDVCEWHKYAAEWDEHEVRLFIDDKLYKTSPQTILYPLQIMIDLFEFPKDEESRRDQKYPKRGDVKEVIGGKLANIDSQSHERS